MKNKIIKYYKKIKTNPILVWHYFVGYTRYYLLQIEPLLVRLHIREQFEYRKLHAAKCLSNKSCLACGCDMPAVLLSNKECGLVKLKKEEWIFVGLSWKKEICYGPLLNKKDWNNFKNKF